MDTPTSKLGNKPEVAVVYREDYEGLADFLGKFPGDTRSAESWLARLCAWWDDNPAFSDQFERGWVLRDSGKIVGFVGAIPAKFQLNGSETTVFAGTTWRVLPEYRGMSMALKNRQMKSHKGALHFSTTPAPKVAELLRLLGYKNINGFRGTSEQTIVILKFEKLLLEKLSSRFPWGILAKACASLGALYQACLIWRLDCGKKLQVRKITKADSSFDDLWKRTRDLYPNTNIRTAAVIDWFCFSILASEKTLLGCYDEERLVGFMMLLAEEKAGMRISTCIDLWIDPLENEAQIAAGLISEAARLAGRAKMDRLVIPHFNRRVAGILSKLKLLRRPAWDARELIGGPKDDLARINQNNSYFVGAQGDIGL